MTEDEAKTKWCPLVRDNQKYGGVQCIASACMMWRWRYETNHLHEVTLPATHGYCGVAGKWP